MLLHIIRGTMMFRTTLSAGAGTETRHDMNTRISLALGLAGAFAVAGCVDPAGPTDNQRARQGAVTGAVAGAVIGAARPGSNDVRQAATGAVVGGIIGGAIGSVLDAQARDLRNDLSGNIGVIRQGDQLIVRMPQDLLFATDSASLRPDLRSDLRVVANSLVRYNTTIVDVVGHTDNTGTAAYNQSLSERRASSVAGELQAGGVPGSRIRAYGRGESQPVASNLTPEGRQQNRRVELIIRETR
jgi:outer membrane protein OmpA-like peptidoglycan-associated protein